MKSLVLEGGAMRGLFSAGILDVLMENNISVDGIAGVSAGAAFGCNFKSKQIKRVIRYNKKYCRDKRYCSLWSWIKTGDLFGAEFCYRKLPKELDIFDGETFEKNPLEFYLVCTDVEKGEPFYYQCTESDDECFEYMRASASMPLVSKIVETPTGKYLDGAITDSIPLKFMESKGYTKNIVILTQVKNYVKKPPKLMLLMRFIYRKYPKLLEVMANRHKMYNEQIKYIEQQAETGKILLLRPEKTLPVKRICRNPEILQQTYDIGREYALKNLEKIKSFLN